MEASQLETATRIAPKQTARPYLSLVIPTRNDDYPSNGMVVQNKSLLILQRQLEDAAIDSEILVVDYNSDPAGPPLPETLRVDEGRSVSIKVLSVDAKYHRRFRYWDRRAFHQTCAVNVGLRRSRGKFFVYRAADHIYSNALVDFLRERSLREDTIYRCDRVDIECDAFEPAFEARLDRISSVCDRYAVDRYDPIIQEPSLRLPSLHTHACGDFLLMSRDLWMRVAGLRETRMPVFLDADSLAFHAAYAVCRSQTILDRDCCVYKLYHGSRAVVRLSQAWEPRWQRLDRKLMRIGNGVANLSRAVFNYPRRIDRQLPGVLLDSFERNFVLPAFLWSHGIPSIRQNWGKWGLRDVELSETVLATAAWELPKPRSIGLAREAGS